MNNQITQQVALDRGIEPIRTFMFKQTHEKELALFVRMAKIEKPKTKEEEDKIWLARRSAFAACTKIAPNVMSEDIVVSIENFPIMIAKIKEITNRYKLQTALLAHAGDGNIHPHIIIDLRDKDEVKRFEKAKDEMFMTTIQMGGTLSGEHGIGLEKKKYMPHLLEKENLELQKKLKQFFDKNDIMNPGKIF